MKRFLLSLIALIFPWGIMLINDDPVGALIALLMQITLIGWIPASIWGFRVAKQLSKKKPNKDKAT